MGARISRWIGIHDKSPKINYSFYEIRHGEKRNHRLFLQNNFKAWKKIRPCLFHLPANYKYNQELLERIVASLDHNFKNVIEFRDWSWWNNQVYQTLHRNNIAFCNMSSPLKWIKEGDLHLTTNDLYIRFHGIDIFYVYDYS